MGQVALAFGRGQNDVGRMVWVLSVNSLACRKAVLIKTVLGVPVIVNVIGGIALAALVWVRASD